MISDADRGIASDKVNVWRFARMKKGISRIPGSVHDDGGSYGSLKDVVYAFSRHFSEDYGVMSSISYESDTLRPTELCE